MNSIVVRLSLLALLSSLAVAAKRPFPPRRCSVDVCFAVEGSGAMSAADFAAQKDFIKRLSWLVGPFSKAGGTQFGISLEPIAKVTSNNSGFRDGLRRLKKGNADRTFVAAGLAFCVKELGGRRRLTRSSVTYRRRAVPVSNRRKVIVLMHDGKAAFGSGSITAPLRVFDGKVFAVAVGNADRAALARITGDWRRVFVAWGFNGLQQIVGSVAQSICGNA